MNWTLPPGIRALLPERAESLTAACVPVTRDETHITSAFFELRMGESFGFPPWVLTPPDVPALQLLAGERPPMPGCQNPFTLLAVQVARCVPGQHFACTPQNYLDPRSDYDGRH